MRFSQTLLIVGVALQSVFSSPVTVPTQSLFRAFVADLNGLQSVADQWRSGSSVTFAWDLNANCYSEQWIVGGPGMPDSTQAQPPQNGP